MWDRCTPAFKDAILRAGSEATLRRHNYITPEHFLLALIAPESDLLPVFAAAGVKLGKLQDYLEARVPLEDPSFEAQSTLTRSAKLVADQAYAIANEIGDVYLEPCHILLGLIAEGNSIAARALVDAGLTLQRARDAIASVRSLQPRQTLNVNRIVQGPAAFLYGPCIPHHLVLNMLANPSCAAYGLLRKQCDDIGGLQLTLWTDIVRLSTAPHVIVDHTLLDRVLFRAQLESGSTPLKSDHLLLAILGEAKGIATDILEAYGITESATRDLISHQ